MKNKIKEPNFVEKDVLYLVECPECKRENYAMNVARGICTWCGLDGYPYYNLKRKDDGEQEL